MLHVSGDLIDMIPVHRAGVIHVQPHHIELIPVAADEEAFEAFQHVCAVADYGTRCRDAWKRGEPWPVLRPIEPKASVS